MNYFYNFSSFRRIERTPTTRIVVCNVTVDKKVGFVSIVGPGRVLIVTEASDRLGLDFINVFIRVPKS
jgi:hypothetical protein